MNEAAPATANRPATLVLALLRIGIGWHFLYEGITKLLDPNWTSAGYLQESTGPLAAYFQRITSDPGLQTVVDQLNIWGLMVIGLALMLGLFTRAAALFGILLLGLYYLAYPPLFGPAIQGVEGNYLVVSKNLVELLALCVVLALPAKALGIDGVRAARRARRSAGMIEAAAGAVLDPAAAAAVSMSRRRTLAGLVGLPFLGGFVLAVLKRHGWNSHEENRLTARIDAYSGATIKKFDFSKTAKDIKGTLPQGQIGNVKLSRMLLGGNLIGGWAHSRDLIYVSKLVKAYHNRAKVFETFQLAEACGINTFMTNPILCEIINDYWRTTRGKMQFISDCGGANVLEMTKKSIDAGAAACYFHGGIADSLVAEGNFDAIQQVLDLIRKNGLPAGIGGHKLATVRGCVEKGVVPDFWMKTLHRTNYWSARPNEEQCDNIWCEQPEETVAYMKTLRQPWIAFKTLAAGALMPQDGFRYAFQSGADFICVGMYDFQIVEDVNLALDVLNGKLERQRDWLA